MNLTVIENSVTIIAQGKDALRYLNARLTNDIRLVTTTTYLTAAALSPQGRPEGFFSVYSPVKDLFILSCDGGDRHEIISAFKRYIVADRIVVTDLSEKCSILHIFDFRERSQELREALQLSLGAYFDLSGLDAALNKFNSKAEEPTYLPLTPIDQSSDQAKYPGLLALRPRYGSDGIDLIIPQNHEEIKDALQKSLCVINSEDKKLLSRRIEAGIPLFPSEISPKRHFLESGQKSSVSFKKGCYVGQEVVEKVDSYGSLPRTLKRIKLDGTLLGEVNNGNLDSVFDIADPKSEIGSVLTIAENPETHCIWAYALLRSDKVAEKCIFAGRPARVI